MYCRSCGKEMKENEDVCSKCGTTVENEEKVEENKINSENNYNSNMNSNNYNANMRNNNYNANMNNYNYNQIYTDPRTNCIIPYQYKPLGAWAYFGWTILFAIPCVGPILIIVFSLRSSGNINLRNFARSYLCIYLLVAIIALIVLLISFLIGARVVNQITL